MTDEVLHVIRGQNKDLLMAFDSEFASEALSFAGHAARTYGKLGIILAMRDKAHPPHWPLAATYMLDAVNSLVGAFTVLRSGFPLQALDLLRRVIETACVAVYICDHPKLASDPKLSKLPAGKCVSYARRHLPNIGRPYGAFSFFDHPHSAMFAPFLTSQEGLGRKLAYPLGPSSILERRSFFLFVVLQSIAHAHNVEGVTEMLFFPGLEAEKRFWVSSAEGIQYEPIGEERQCEQTTLAALRRLEPILAHELLAPSKGHEVG